MVEIPRSKDLIEEDKLLSKYFTISDADRKDFLRKADTFVFAQLQGIVKSMDKLRSYVSPIIFGDNALDIHLKYEKGNYLVLSHGNSTPISFDKNGEFMAGGLKAKNVGAAVFLANFFNFIPDMMSKELNKVKYEMYHGQKVLGKDIKGFEVDDGTITLNGISVLLQPYSQAYGYSPRELCDYLNNRFFEPYQQKFDKEREKLRSIPYEQKVLKYRHEDKFDKITRHLKWQNPEIIGDSKKDKTITIKFKDIQFVVDTKTKNFVNIIEGDKPFLQSNETKNFSYNALGFSPENGKFYAWHGNLFYEINPYSDLHGESGNIVPLKEMPDDVDWILR